MAPFIRSCTPWLASSLLVLTAGLSGCGGDKKAADEAKPAEPMAATVEEKKVEEKKAEEAKPQKLVIYTARKEHLIKPLIVQYEAETGIEIEYLTDKAAPLLAKLEAEGENTPADILMTVDAGNLWQAGEKGVLAAVESETLTKNVPEHFRDPQSRWFGLSVRARTIFHSTERVKPEELSTYEDLADPKWKGRLCLRTSKKVYNQSLVATLIENLGEEKAESIVKGWVANLATDVFSNDTKMLEAIAAGQCDVGIANTYYFGRLQKATPDIPVAVFWPNQADRGVHVNISGAGVTKHAKSPELAQAFIEWLSSDAAQGSFAGLNQEFPVNAAVPVSEEVKAWGEFKGDTINVEAAGRLQVQSVKLMDRAGYK